MRVFASVFRPWLILCLAGLALPTPRANLQKEASPSLYRKWLEEEAVCIISPLKKEVFEKFQTNPERDLFITAFWRQLDPTPGTDQPPAPRAWEKSLEINPAQHDVQKPVRSLLEERQKAA